MKRIMAALLALCVTAGTVSYPAGMHEAKAAEARDAGNAETDILNAESVSDFKYVELANGDLKIIKYKGNATELVIPPEVGGKKVVMVGFFKTIPLELDEAAIIDGANFWQRFRNVTVPFLAPAFTYCIPLWLAAGLRMYDYSFVATSGGPQHSTETMAYYIYSYLFPYNKVFKVGRRLMICFPSVPLPLSF